jgi:hypothetical protein
MRPPTVRAVVAVTFALFLSAAIPFAGANAASHQIAAGAPVFRGPDNPKAAIGLTEAQVSAYSRHATERVLIVMKQQFTSMITRSHRLFAMRDAGIAATQKPVLHELAQVHATHVKAFTLINVIKATISKAEAAHLSRESGVRAVVPDALVPRPKLYSPAPDALRRAVVKHNAALPKCNTPASLEPEALQVTNTAFSNPKTPQAQNYATGKGVLVAFLADQLDPFNSDFIRPDGSPVFVDYEDFSGYGPSIGLNGGEAWLDASMLAAQGNETYSLNPYLAPPYLGTKPCESIRLLGLAPGASLMGLDIFGQNPAGAFDSTIVAAIQYAVLNGANVINESFGGAPFPNDNIDAVVMANDAAVAAGSTVVASTGDSGLQNTIGSPATDPNIISAAASTTFRSTLQSELSGANFAKGWISNQISAISSSGVTATGDKTPDVLAPGDATWILCGGSPGCPAYSGASSGISGPFGGTSESAPEVSAEAALVIQAYRDKHKGATPNPDVVKQIITSTAGDIGAPSAQEGHGLINSLAAVKAAMRWGAAKVKGNALLTAPTTLSAAGKPGTPEALGFSVTNQGSATQTVTPKAVTLGAPTPLAGSPFALALDTTNDQTFYDGAGRKRAYVMQKFVVTGHPSQLDAAIDWSVIASPGTLVRITLFDPKMRFAGWSWPLSGQGAGHVAIEHPQAGTWTALIWTAASSLGYTGPVSLAIGTSNYVSAGAVTPKSAKVKGGGTANFALHTAIPAASGDRTAALRVTGTLGTSGVIPVILRSRIPVAVGSPGNFSGNFLGGNDGGPQQTLTYDFSVPAGVGDVNAAISWTDANLNITGLLVDPSGYSQDSQSSIATVDTDPSSPGFGTVTSYNHTLQFSLKNPQPGVWRLVLVVNTLSGQEIAEPFQGTISLNALNVTSAGVPNSASTKLIQGKAATATITVTNTGNTTENYFVDPRLAQTSNYYLGGEEVSLPGPRTGLWWVPPATTSLSIAAESLTPTVPIYMDVSPNSGGPDFQATPGINVFGHYMASATVTAPDITPGEWDGIVEMVGPFAGPAATTIDEGAIATTRAFDGDTTTPTGDLWAILTGQSAGSYTPLTLAPGASGTIDVSITPSASSGTNVTGTMYVDTFQSAGMGFPQSPTSFNITGEGGDTVAAIPYNYTVQ